MENKTKQKALRKDTMSKYVYIYIQGNSDFQWKFYRKLKTGILEYYGSGIIGIKILFFYLGWHYKIWLKLDDWKLDLKIKLDDWELDDWKFSVNFWNLE